MASGKHGISLAAIFQYFHAKDEKTVKRGENGYNSGHVAQIKYDKGLGLVHPDVYASMRDKKYKVVINLTSDGDIQSATCSCPRGQFVCHHMTAAAIYCHYNISSTDLSCSWSQKKPKSDTAVTSSAVNFKKGYVAMEENEITEESVAALVANSKLYGRNLGIVWLLSPDPQEDENIIPYIEKVLLSEKFPLSTNKVVYLKEAWKLDYGMVHLLVTKTIGQSSNPTWLIARKHRVTASNFGVTIKACRNKRCCQSLLKRLAGVYSLAKVRAVQWGRQHEADAVFAYEEATGIKTAETGLRLHENGVLGASPDRLIGDDGLLEVKCPFTFRNSHLKNVLTKDYIIYFNNANQVIVNTKHDYYSQVQGQIYLIKRKYAILAIWTTIDFLYVKIYKDPDWGQNLQLLEQFYFEKYIPYLCNT